MNERESLTYRDAGVDIDAGGRLVDRIRPAVQSTGRSEVLGGFGGFGGLIEVPAGYRRPVLVAGTDGVGTKLLLAHAAHHHRGLGIDLVAMCVNDVIVQGAEPLFFMDYYATGRLDEDVAAAVIEGVAEGCRASGAALLGGETAEMPGLYEGSHFDLAGFCVGVAERDALIDGPRQIEPGDRLIALPSSGPHANGFSLIRRILDKAPAPDDALLERLLAPTRIYAGALRTAQASGPLHGAAHITGGGLLENLPRILPEGCAARLESWRWPEVFVRLAEAGGVAHHEMLRTFNCGVGMVLCVPEREASSVLEALRGAGEPEAWLLGEVVERGRDDAVQCPGDLGMTDE